MSDLIIGGETFRVDIAGETTRPACLLAHPLGSDLTIWDGQMKLLSQHFRVIRYDSRGHGASVGADQPISLARLGRDALAIMDALEIETAHFIGGSMGGAVGQWLLVNAPHRIDRAVLANTAAKLGTPDSWNERIRLAITGGMTGIADATIERWFSPAFTTRDAPRVEAIRDVLLGTDPAGYAACCAALRDMDLREALLGIDRPVLVVSGIDDPAVGDKDIALLLTSMGNAAHVALAAKHISSIEAEAEFNAAVVDFLTAKLPRLKAPSKPTSGRAVPPASPSRVKRQVAAGSAASARNPLRKTTGATAAPPSAKKAAAKPAHKRVAASKAGQLAASSSATVRVKPAVKRKAVEAPARVKAAPKAKSADKARRAPTQAAKGARAGRVAVKPAATASKRRAAAEKTAAARPADAKTLKAKTQSQDEAKTSKAKTSTAKTIKAKAITGKKVAGKKAATKVDTKKAALTKGGAKTSTAKALPARTLAGKSAPAVHRRPAAKARGLAGRRRP